MRNIEDNHGLENNNVLMIVVSVFGCLLLVINLISVIFIMSYLKRIFKEHKIERSKIIP